MRIVWAGPWNELSAIAEFGVEVVEQLVARGYAVDVVRTELGQSATLPPRPAPVPIRFWGDVSIHELQRNVDAVIVNFGDHYWFHGGMLENFAQVGVVGIFHDRFLAHLAVDWANTAPSPQARLRQMVEATYGKEAWGEDEPFLADFETVSRTRPMLEWFASGVCGAVVHGHHYADAVRRVCPGPVAVIPIALQFEDLPAPRPLQSDALVIATVGVGNTNKQMDQVLSAMASSARLRERCRFRLIGQIDPAYQAKLTRLAAALGLHPPEFTGWVTDAELNDRLADVDVLACLRYPALEGASGSLVLALQSARPTIVSRHAAYAELPQGLVLGCTPGDEAGDLARHLEWVLDDHPAARAMGERARAYSRATHTAANYVDVLMPLVESAVASRPTMLTGQALGRSLATFGIQAGDPAIGRVGMVLSDLLGSPRDGH